MARTTQVAEIKDETASISAGLPVHEKVYRAMRDMVLFGDFAPGDAVTINGLTMQLGAGTTPVREGLRRLISDGALVFQGNRRISVPVLDAAALDELAIVRAALEPELARRAAKYISRDGIARLRSIDAALDASILRGDIPMYLRKNYRFHETLNAAAEAPILTGMVDALWLRFGPSLRIVCGQYGTRGLPDMHKAILNALERRDGEAAAEAMLGDVEQGMSFMRDAIRDPGTEQSDSIDSK